MAGIVVVGSSNTDLIVQLPHIPAPGETVLGGRYSQAAGGKGANQAVAAARAGGKVTFITCVGDDAMGRQAVAGYEAQGIDVSHIRVDSSQQSGVAVIFVADDGQNSIGVASGANMALTPADVHNAVRVLRNADVLLVQLEVPMPTVIAAIEVAHAAGVTVILDPAPAPKEALHADLLGLVTLLTPDEGEASRLSGIDVAGRNGASEAAWALRQLGAANVLVSLGGAGALLATPEGEQFIDAFKVKAVDTTAAGDTRNGAMAAALAEGATLLDAIRFGSAAAAVAVSRLGAQPSIPNRREIDAMLARA
jgi:ribokinase